MAIRLNALLIAAIIAAFGCIGNRTTGVDEGGDALVCEAGQPDLTRACSANCAPGFAGRRVCNSTGTAFRECRCVSTGNNPSTTCTPGETRGLCTLECRTPSGYAGVTQGNMLCNASRTAFECVRTSGACMGSVCQPGVQTSCPCGGSQTGTQSCNSEGTGYTTCACPTNPTGIICNQGQTNGSCQVSCSGGGTQPGAWTCNATRLGYDCLPVAGTTCSGGGICNPGQADGTCSVACTNGGSQPGTRMCNAARTGYDCLPVPGSACSGGGFSCTPNAPTGGSCICPGGNGGSQFCNAAGNGYVCNGCGSSTGVACTMQGLQYASTVCTAQCGAAGGTQTCTLVGGALVLQGACTCATSGTTCTPGSFYPNAPICSTRCASGSGTLTCTSAGVWGDLCSCTPGGVSSSAPCANGATEVVPESVCSAAACGPTHPGVRVCVNYSWTTPSGVTNCGCAGSSAPPGLDCEPSTYTHSSCTLPTGMRCSSTQIEGQWCSSDGRSYGGCVCVPR